MKTYTVKTARGDFDFAETEFILKSDLLKWIEKQRLCSECGFALEKSYYCDFCKERVATPVCVDGLLESIKQALKKSTRSKK